MTPRNLKKHPSPENGVESLGIGGLVSHCGTFHVERCDFGHIQDLSLPEEEEELTIHQDFARSLTRPLNLTSFPSREMRRDKKKVITGLVGLPMLRCRCIIHHWRNQMILF